MGAGWKFHTQSDPFSLLLRPQISKKPMQVSEGGPRYSKVGGCTVMGRALSGGEGAHWEGARREFRALTSAGQRHEIERTDWGPTEGGHGRRTGDVQPCIAVGVPEHTIPGLRDRNAALREGGVCNNTSLFVVYS